MRQAALARCLKTGEITVKFRIPLRAAASPQDHCIDEAEWLKRVPVHALRHYWYKK